jgi:hypothetical protein
MWIRWEGAALKSFATMLAVTMLSLASEVAMASQCAAYTIQDGTGARTPDPVAAARCSPMAARLAEVHGEYVVLEESSRSVSAVCRNRHQLCA